MNSPQPDAPIAEMSRRSWARRVLAGLNPIEIVRGIPGAVFHKEIAVSGRRLSTYITRGAFVAAILGFTALVTSAGVDRWGGPDEGPAARLQKFQSVAPGVTMTISWCAFIGLTLVAVSRGGSSIADERRMGTLGALMTTPLRAWQIVFGKMLSIMAEIVILGLATAPLLLAVRALGGVSGMLIAQLTVITLVHAALACILSIFWSVSVSKSGNAMISGLLLLALIEIAPPLLALLADSVLDRFGTSFSSVCGRAFGVALEPFALLLLSCTPVVFQWSMAELMGIGGGFGAGASELAGVHIAYLAFWLITGFFATSLVLRGRLSRDAAGAASAPTAKKKRKTLKPAPNEPAQPHPGHAPVRTISAGRSREVGDHPVQWRELQQSPFRKPWQAWVAGAAIALFLLYLDIQVGVREEGLHLTIGVIATIAMICIAAVSTTSGISAEREGRTWDTLLTTPLSARDIIFGKFVGAIRKQYFVPLVLTGQLLLAGVATGHVGVLALPTLGAVLAGPLALLTASGIAYSLLLKRSSAAATLNFLTAVVLFGVLPALAGTLLAFSNASTGARGFAEYLFGAIISFNPVGMGVLALGGEMDSPMVRGGRYDFFGIGHLGKAEFLGLVILVLAIELGAAYICLRSSARFLADQTGRRD